MKQLAELVPLVLIFIAYQMKGTTVTLGDWPYTFDGIFSATAVLIIATSLQVLLTWIFTRELEKRLLWLLAAVCVFGGATLVFRDETFIIWKPTVFNWTLALAFGASQFIGERNLVRRMMEGSISLPDDIWRRLNFGWVVFFIAMGALNLYVAYEFDTDTWVNFKLFGLTALMFVFVFAQMLYLFRYMIPEEDAEEQG